MYSKSNLFSYITSLFKILLIAVIGTSSFVFIYQLLLDALDTEYFILLCLIEILIVFAIVSLIITEIYHYSFSKNENTRTIYTSKSMIMLYIKSTLIVIAGLVVAMMYNFKVARANEISVIDVSFYIMVFMLTFFALKGIVNGERLRNESFKRIQSENNLLKSQLNPHFLYNTLNNIDALIWISPEKASDSILKLSHIMRYMTYKTKLSLVPINDEVNYLSEYVELQKLRYNNDKVIDFKVNVEDKSKSIAPMLLIPFVENAFKHSTNVDSDGAIKINIDSNSRKLSFRIENPADKSVIEKRKEDMLKKNLLSESGRGLVLVENRLKLIYRNKYSLIIDNTDNKYKVSLDIDI